MTEENKADETVQPFPAPQTQQIDAQQIQQAAQAGTRLLADGDLKVSLSDAMALQVLRPILMGLAQGQLAIVGAEDAAKMKEKEED